MKTALIAAFSVIVLTASPAAAQNMPLHQFVERGTKLEKKGPMALFHRGEIRALQTEMQAAGARVREERLAAEKTGRKGAYCPPNGGSSGTRMNAQQLLKELRAIAAAQPRSTTTADGMRIMLAKRYPCPS